jgi:DNA topoisomerase-1
VIAPADDEQQAGDAEENDDAPAPKRRGGRRPASGSGASGGGTGKRLVIVESPAKARTIARFLGPDYVVESSIGHIRDLPSTAAEVPAGVTGEAKRLGVDVDHGFKPVYVIPAGKKQQVAKLRKLLRAADELYLATDEDREGEAIAWHLREVLKPRVPVRRMVFHEITQKAIEEALASPRNVDEQLVEAQEARRILDRLFGYEVSPVLWKKVRPRLSAGRVQSAATRIIVDRERERMRFVRSGYWDLDGTLATREPATAEASATLRARLVEARGKRVATGRDFDAATGQLAPDAEVTLLDEALAGTLAQGLRGTELRVSSVTERPYTQRPPAPFVTSTLQQESARQLRFTAQRAMQVAQQLYENGFITYMRTDSTQLSDQAISAARRQIGELYGADYLPDSPRRYKARGRGAQEAHEAIRPAGEILRTPESLARELAALGPDAPRLYELVWKRTVASQMRDAQGMRTQVRMQGDARGPSGESEPVTLAASGKVIRFPGFLRAYVEGSDDPDAELEDQERLLPPLSEGQLLDAREAEARGHETQPPARYTEASLVRELEERGIGRPSTYAAILQTIQDRGYVTRRGTQLVPSFTAFAVIQLLERHFAELVDLEFTARMEDDLDAVAEGRIAAGPWLHHLYFGHRDDEGHEPGEGAALAGSLAEVGLKEAIGSGWEAIDARAISTIPLGEDEQGRPLVVRVGRYGPYVQVGEEKLRADVPEDLAPDELTVERALSLLAASAAGEAPLGTDSASGEPVYLRTGRYGPYVQLGEDPERNEKGKIPANAPKPRRASLWAGITPETLTLEQALELLSFPKTLGEHPESGDPVTVQDGPRGPYVRAGEESRSLRDLEHLRSVTLEEALRVLAEPSAERRGGPQAPIAEIGAHPVSGEPIVVRSGRFGPYVTDGTLNASVPKGTDAASLGIDEAVTLLAAREQRIREQGGDPTKKPARGRAGARRGGRRSA